MTPFCQTFATQLHKVVPTTNQCPVRVWAADESRFGFHTIRRRRITARGVKPVRAHQHRFENTWIFGAVEQLSGAIHFMEFLQLTTATMQQFLDDFAQTHAASLNVLVLDNAGSHTAHALRLPENVVLLFQPPYEPEVNPVERVWLALKTATAWCCFADLTALRQHLVGTVASYTEPMLRALTQYPYLVAGVNALSL